ncbi:MAG: ABC transporter substrate-binding protein [Epulopiscium sp.]|nr:ABC transporter substrate-binding protein [Candidatus Epulonipiscium sp.]
MFSIIMIGLLIMSSLSGCASTKESDVIKIGASFALTGDVAVYGIAARNGVELALKEQEEIGNVLGKKIQFVVEDNKGSEVDAANAFNKLVDREKIDVFLGSDISGTTLAIAELAAEKNIPMVTPTATAWDVTTKGDNIFRACYIDAFQGGMMGKFAATDLQGKTAAILYDVGSDFSEGNAEAFEENFVENGGTILSKQGYTKDDQDFKSILTNVKNQNPEVLFIPDYYEKVALITRQVHEVGIDAILLGVDGWDGVIEQAKDFPDAVDGAYFVNHYSADDPNPEIQRFVKKYKETYGELPNALAALGYDTGKIILSAIEKAGTLDSNAIIKALKETNGDYITGHIQFDEYRNPIKSVTVLKIEKVDDKLVQKAFTTIEP